MSQKSKKKKNLPDQEVLNKVTEIKEGETLKEEDILVSRVSQLHKQIENQARDIREYLYQLRLRDTRISALLYALTLTESEKKEDHTIKEGLRQNRDYVALAG